jgi:methionyl-tRNA formyltransferase
VRIVIATSRAWNEWIAEDLKKAGLADVLLITTKNELTYEKLKAFKPDFIFIPHWSFLIKDEVFNNFECVIFHMTDLPYGRGGSPLQNLIVRGHKTTKLTALKCTSELDGGPIYLKRDLDLSGSAKEIFERSSKLTCEMIKEIIVKKLIPALQTGEVVEFVRRTPQESDIQNINNLSELNDHIRMLDAEGYPHAFLETEHFRFEFTDARLDREHIFAKVKIVRKNHV